MPGKKPVLVLCPGAWCDPGYFRLTTDILEKAGYTCLPVSLPSVGSELRPKDAPPITHGLQYAARNRLSRPLSKSPTPAYSPRRMNKAI